jgi:pectinesterase
MIQRLFRVVSGRATAHAAVCASLLLSATASSPLAAQGATLVVQAENALAFARADEVLSLPWATITARLAGATADKVRARDVGSGRELPSQVLDADGNGTPDSLLVLADFRGKEARRVAIEMGAPAKFPARTFVRHDVERDDMAWESDKLAWRIYGQGLKKTSSAMSSSGVDIWVKKTRELIVEKWYTKGHDAYHVDDGEGADFYDVGETLGAGGTALWFNDSLVRADNFTQWKVVATGPIRTIFTVEYPEWKAGTLAVTQTKRFIIDAGSNLYREESVFRAPAGTREIPYVIGELKRAGMVGTMSRTNAWAWLTGWGPTTPKKGGDGEIGTAVLLPRDRVRDWKETSNHYLAVTYATPNTPVVHYVGAGWTLSGDFRDVRDWWRYLDEYAQRLASPISVKVLAP